VTSPTVLGSNHTLGTTVVTWNKPATGLVSLSKELETIDKKLKKAGRECEDGQVENTVKDAGSVCESLIGILCHRVHGKHKPKEPIGTLGELKTRIDAMFGAPVYYDLDFVRATRNDATHDRTLPV
jgi:hypothetical protein